MDEREAIWARSSTNGRLRAPRRYLVESDPLTRRDNWYRRSSGTSEP